MKFIEYNNRDFAINLLAIRRKGKSVCDALDQTKDVIIYGCGFFGREIYHEVNESKNLLCFIDRKYDGKSYNATPVYSLHNPSIQKLIDGLDSVYVIITPYAYWDEIVPEVKQMIPNSICLSLYDITAKLKVLEPSIIGVDKNTIAQNVLLSIVEKKEVDIKNVVICGTIHSVFLSMLIDLDWEHTLFVNCGVAGKTLSEGMTRNGVSSFYADFETGSEGGVMDICRCVSDYCRRFNLQVYGNEHVLEAESFLSLGMKVVEDGVLNYTEDGFDGWSSFLENRTQYYPGGYEDVVDRVFLTGFMNLHGGFPKEKVCIINPQEIWARIDDAKKHMICDIFKFPYDELRMIDNDAVLFLTESFFDDGFGLYNNGNIDLVYEFIKELLALYDPSKIVIKPHPRDQFDYKRFFPGMIVLDSVFPSELIAYTGIEFDTILLYHDSVNNYIFEKLYGNIITYRINGK